jgi:hypothetical protein
MYSVKDKISRKTMSIMPCAGQLDLGYRLFTVPSVFLSCSQFSFYCTTLKPTGCVADSVSKRTLYYYAFGHRRGKKRERYDCLSSFRHVASFCLPFALS